MSYMQEIDQWLDELLAGLKPEQLAQAKKDIKAKILESYRNGQNANPRKTTKGEQS